MALHPHASAFLDLAKAANLPDISVQGATTARGYSHGQPDLGGEIDPTVDISIEFQLRSTRHLLPRMQNVLALFISMVVAG